MLVALVLDGNLAEEEDTGINVNTFSWDEYALNLFVQAVVISWVKPTQKDVLLNFRL